MRRRRDRADHASARPANAGKPGFETELAERTLTNLYNQRPAWLAQAHETLDVAVAAAAYGWTDYTNAMPDGDNLRRLLALNLERSRQSLTTLLMTATVRAATIFESWKRSRSLLH